MPKDLKTQTLNIVEQNHYNPFGLKHENYSSERWVFAKDDEVAPLLVLAAPNPEEQILDLAQFADGTYFIWMKENGKIIERTKLIIKN